MPSRKAGVNAKTHLQARRCPRASQQIERQRQRELAVAQQKVLGVQAEIDATMPSSSADHLRSGRLTAASLARISAFAAAMRQKPAPRSRSRAPRSRRRLTLLKPPSGKIMETRGGASAMDRGAAASRIGRGR